MADLKISQLTGATTPLAGTEVLPVVQSGVTKQVSVANLTAGRATSAGSLDLTTGGLNVLASEAYNTLQSSGGIGSNARVRFRAVYTGGGSGYGGSFELESRQQNNVWNTGAFTVTDEGNISTTGNLIQGTAAKGINFTANTPAAGMTSQLLNWYEEGTWTPAFFRDGTNAVLTYGTQGGTYTRIGRLVTLQCYLAVDAVTSQGTGFWYVSGLPFTARVGTIRASGTRGQYSAALFSADMDTIFVGGGNDVANLGNGGAANNSAVIATGAYSFTMSYEV